MGDLTQLPFPGCQGCIAFVPRALLPGSRDRVQRDGPGPSPGWGSRRRKFCVRARPFPLPFASVGARALWLGGWDAQSIQENQQKPRNALGSTPILTGRAWWSPCVQREVSKLSQFPGRLAHCLARSQGAPRPTWAQPVWLSVLNRVAPHCGPRVSPSLSLRVQPQVPPAQEARHGGGGQRGPNRGAPAPDACRVDAVPLGAPLVPQFRSGKSRHRGLCFLGLLLLLLFESKGSRASACPIRLLGPRRESEVTGGRGGRRGVHGALLPPSQVGSERRSAGLTPSPPVRLSDPGHGSVPAPSPAPPSLMGWSLPHGVEGTK